MSLPEKFYTVTEVAEQWKLAYGVVLGLFRDRPGVLQVARPAKLHKRRYTTIRIPESMKDKVYAELTRGRKK